MYALFVTVLCALAFLGSAKDDSVERECCKNIGPFKDCRRECRKVWIETKPAKKLQLVFSLPKVCPSHLENLWKCFNSSVKGLHHYMNLNLKLSGKSCCLLANGAACRTACLATNVVDLQQSCPREEEQSLLRCIDRNTASQTCCQSTRSNKRCIKACQIVFSSDKEPSRKKIQTVRKKCGKNYIFKCVKNATGYTRKSTFPDHRCCQMTDVEKCQDVCKEVLSSRKPAAEKMRLLKNSCREHHPFYHKVWRCFLIYAVTPQTKNPSKDPVDKADVRLHCCLRAKTEQCLKFCLKRYSEGDEAVQKFYRRCEFNPLETTMLTCIADVSTPCHIGCSNLKFCTNFNYRHTELFRSCNKEADVNAKYDFENWWKKGRVKIPAMDVIPVKDIKKCLPEMWKAIACVLQIKPCHVKSHGSVICRKDCLKVLGDCAKILQLGVRSVETICEGLSPDEQSSCISIEDYTKPSLFKKETPEVTHPCYPNPCKNQDVCEINRAPHRKNSMAFVPYECTPGCPIDLQSKLLIRNGDLARLPIVQNSKLEGCYKICRCDQEQLSDCPRLPNCVQQKSCQLPGSKELYKHQDKFYINCNFCSCFDGEVFCSKKQCLPGAEYNGTGRPRRNHSPKDGSNEVTITRLPCSCSSTYDPVCGTNGKTYRNFCFARCANLKQNQVSKGSCISKNPCSPSPCDKENKFCVVDRKICIGTKTICPQYVCVPRQQDCGNATTEFLCDNENNQHFNKCSLYKVCNEIAYTGDCKILCAPGRQEVCGIDGQTYSSICALNYAHMLMDYEGPCSTVGKYASEDATIRCAYIKCPVLKPDNCVGVTPPGACCKICATQLVVVFSEDEVVKTNEIVLHQSQPITQKQVVARVRRHLSVSECDLFGFYSIYGDFVLLIKTITENPTKLQFIICNKEAQKIETLIHTASPMFTSDGILSSFRAASLTASKLSEKNVATVPGHSSGHSLSLLLFLVSLLLSWPR